jgi:hypothetical protein
MLKTSKEIYILLVCLYWMVKVSQKEKKDEPSNNITIDNLVKAIEELQELFPEITYKQCKLLETDLSFRQGFFLGIDFYRKNIRYIREHNF